MATKRRTIKSRRETISARKKRRSLLNPLQRELDKPLAKSFKEGAAVAAVVAGPGKFAKAGSKVTKAVKKLTEAIKKKRGIKAKKIAPQEAAFNIKLEKAGLKRKTKAFKDKADKSGRTTEDRIRSKQMGQALDQQKITGPKVGPRTKASDARSLRNESLIPGRTGPFKKGGFKSAAEQRKAKANIKALRARSKASVKKNVAERKALGKRLEAQTKAEQLRIRERNKIKALRARSKASVKKNVAERKALRKSLEKKEPAAVGAKAIKDRKFRDESLARLKAIRAGVKTKSTSVQDTLKTVKKKKPLQGANVDKPTGRRIDPTEQKRLRDIRLRDERAIQKRASAKFAKRGKSIAEKNERLRKAEKARRLEDIQKSNQAVAESKRRLAKSQKELNRAKIGGKVKPAKIPRITDKVLRESGINPRTLPGGGAKFTGRISKGRKRKRGPTFQ